MNAMLEKRLKGLEGAIVELAKIYEKKKEEDELKKQIAKEVVNLPYYWGEYSGYLEASLKPTCLVAVLTSQRTGEECRWTLDAYNVVLHLREIEGFQTWNDYNLAQKIYYAEDFERLLIKYEHSESEIETKMRFYCKEHNIPYKQYLN